jgi:hypothetical protein
MVMATRAPAVASAPSLLSRLTMTIQLLGTLIALTVPVNAPAESPKPPAELSSVEGRALAAQPGDSLLLIVGDRITVARVDRAGVWCRDVRLRLDGERLRGRVSGQNVELDMSDGRVSGKIAAQAVSLLVARADGALRVTGRFGARAIDEELTPRAISAEIGPCRYELRLGRNEYGGQVSCGGQPEGVRLRVPATLAARGDVELAALLTAILAR